MLEETPTAEELRARLPKAEDAYQELARLLKEKEAMLEFFRDIAKAKTYYGEKYIGEGFKFAGKQYLQTYKERKLTK
jgi:hypothetical protein